jgi:hypothetical protein
MPPTVDIGKSGECDWGGEGPMGLSERMQTLGPFGRCRVKDGSSEGVVRDRQNRRNADTSAGSRENLALVLGSLGFLRHSRESLGDQ